MDGCSDSSIVDSYIYSVTPDGTSGGRNYGIALSNCGNIRILNNHFMSSPVGAITMGGPSCSLINVSNNFFDRSGNTSFLHGVTGSCQYSTFSNNFFGAIRGSGFRLTDGFQNAFNNNVYFNCGDSVYSNVDLLGSVTGSFNNRFTSESFIGTGTLGTIYAIQESTSPVSYRNTYDRCVFQGNGTWFNAFPISFGWWSNCKNRKTWRCIG
jgi:hypothetical protein